MRTETITDEDHLLVRRAVLDPGEALPWHTDRCRRFTVIVQGTELTIELAGDGEPITVPVHPGLAGWDDPDDRVHRAVNTGTGPYEEVVVFFREPGVDPQPEAAGGGSAGSGR